MWAQQRPWLASSTIPYFRVHVCHFLLIFENLPALRFRGRACLYRRSTIVQFFHQHHQPHQPHQPQPNFTILPNFTISTKIHNFDQISQFIPNFTISTNFHIFHQFSQFPPNLTISAKFHNFYKISQFIPNFTIFTKFQNFN